MGGGGVKICVINSNSSSYLESVGDVGHQVGHNVAGCVHGQLVGHPPFVDIHPTPVLHLEKQGGGGLKV